MTGKKRAEGGFFFSSKFQGIRNNSFTHPIPLRKVKGRKIGRHLSLDFLLAAAAAAAKSLQSGPTLCDPRDGSSPGSPVPGILQARTLEWVAISFSNAGK